MYSAAWKKKSYLVTDLADTFGKTYKQTKPWLPKKKPTKKPPKLFLPITVINLFFKRSKSAVTQHKYLTSVLHILMHEVWQNIFAVWAGYITSNTDILGELMSGTLWKALHFGIPIPCCVQTERNIFSILLTLQIIFVFLSCF